MKKVVRRFDTQNHWFCAIALIAVIGFVMAALPLTGCDTGGGDGGNTPGGNIPGGNTPGGGDGGNTPGGNIPGGNTPGDGDGGNTPGGNTPGGGDGGNTPGGNTPGGGDGGNTPDVDNPGGNTPGGNIPGGNTPGSGDETFTVTYNAMGATGTPPQALTVTTGTTITLRDDSGFSKDGYVFDGWYTNIAGTTTNYDIGDNYTVTENVTFYARWLYARTVTFDTGESEATSLIIGDGKTITIPPIPVSNRDFQFLGWSTNAYGTGNSYDADSSYTVSTDVTFYAKWTFSGVYSYGYYYFSYGANWVYRLLTYTFMTDGTCTYKLRQTTSDGSDLTQSMGGWTYCVTGNNIDIIGSGTSLSFLDSNTITNGSDNYTKTE